MTILEQLRVDKDSAFEKLQIANKIQLDAFAAFIALKSEPEWNDESHMLQFLGVIHLASGLAYTFADHKGDARDFRSADMHDAVLPVYSAIIDASMASTVYYEALWAWCKEQGL